MSPTTSFRNISNDGKTADVEGFIIVANKTGFSYDNVELGFTIFELPRTSIYPEEMYGPETGVEQAEFPAALRQEMQSELGRLKAQAPMKRTQRMKNLML